MKYLVKSIIFMFGIIFSFCNTIICMNNNCDELYQKYCNVSRKFLINSEKMYECKTIKLFNRYLHQYVYTDKSRHIYLNGLSHRSRIYLFNKIIKNERELSQYEDFYINDDTMRPIYFKYSSLEIAIHYTGSENQPGNILVDFCNIEDDKLCYKSWNTIFYSNNNLEYEIMLDLEVARRFVDGDKFYDLPIAALLPYLTENKTSCQDFITNDESLFKGQNRIQCAKAIINIIEQGNEACTEEKIRNSMSCLHIDNPDEDSRINT